MPANSPSPADSGAPSSSTGPIISRFASDPDMIELVELFVAELPERINAIHNAQTKGEINAIQRVAHQLKGASGGYGFEQVGAVAATLEAAAKNGNIDGIKRQIDELTAVCSRVVVR